jgi:uncharacterized repeat protein (TIGR01451 family)
MKRNHIAFVSVFAAGLLLVALSNVYRARGFGGVTSRQESGELRGFLSTSVSARAAGRGNPWVTLNDGLTLPAQYQGSSKLVQQLNDNQTRPLSVCSDDFDEDGVPDLVTGYAGTNDGVISVHRGDADAIFPNTSEAITHRSQLTVAAKLPSASGDIQSPFFLSSRAFDVSAAPRFLFPGDFDGDGHRDVVTAETGRAELVLLSGDGHGGFAPARTFALPGMVTAVAAGDVNRMDGLADILVAVKGSGGPRLLVYEGAAGALNADPEAIALPSEAKSIALGQLDESFPIDIAVAAGRELIIVRGRDRKHATLDGKKLDAEPPVVSRIAVSYSIASVAIGDFTGDLRQEIAVLSDDGICHVFARTSQRGSSWHEESAVTLALHKNELAAASRILSVARISSSPKDDLLLLDQSSRQLQILINESATVTDESDDKAIASSTLQVASTIDFDGEPVAVMGMRLNSDALSDLVVLKSDSSSPTVMTTSPAAIITVINTNDSGTGSLRQAIINANSAGFPGADLINFNIPGAGTQTIAPLTPLPALTGPVTIDGSTQSPGSATPPIELAGTNLPVGGLSNGLSVSASNSIVRGLVINRFDSVGVGLSGSNTIVDGSFIGTNAAGTAGQPNGDTGVLINAGSGNLVGGTVAAARNVISANTGHGVQVLLGPATLHQIQGNFIGTNAAGTSGLGNGSDGVNMLSGIGNVTNCTIGGTTAGARNVISANTGVGVQFLTVGTSNLVQGNLIGTDASGSSGVGNGSSGVAVTEATNCTIGGTVPGAGNVISGNGFDGVRINLSTATGNLVKGNKIGTRADGITSLPNSSVGVRVLNSASNNTIGGAPGEGNIIAFNFEAGVMIETGIGNAIQSNSIFANNGLGIDLGTTAGITPNDTNDGDTGANNLQNFPVLTLSNGVPGGGVNVQGTLNSNANTAFTLDFFANSACDPSGNGEGQRFLGSAAVMTNASGNATINANLAASASIGEFITAVATSAEGNSSEFSGCVLYGAADLSVTKTSSSPTITVGSNVTYTISLTNNGPDPATMITVTDNLPASLTFMSCSSTASGVCGGSGNNRTVTFSSLASGASATITIVARLDCAVSNGLSIGNTATVTSVVRDPVSANNSSAVNFTASNPAREISPTSQSFAADGGDGVVNVTAPTGCGWSAMSNVPWITSGAGGIGNGTLGYQVAVNATGSSRMGTITIAGLTFTVNQSNVPCSYSILPMSNSLPASGGGGSVAVTAPAGCQWKAITNDKWIVVTPGTAAGVGNGSWSYTVDPNPDTTARAGTVSVGGQTFTVMQAAAPCSFAIEPTGRLFSEAGSESTFTLTTTSGCEWSPSTTDDWVFITSEESGTGPGVVSYGVRDNTTGSPRQGSITVGGVSFIIVQDGGTLADCIYVLNPSSANFNSAGGSGSIQIVTEERCAWEATTNVTWINLTSQVVGIGTNTVTYTVESNSGPGRAGIIMIGGQLFKVKQKGG